MLMQYDVFLVYCYENYNIPDSTPPAWWVGHGWPTGGSHQRRWATRGVLSGTICVLAYLILYLKHNSHKYDRMEHYNFYSQNFNDQYQIVLHTRTTQNARATFEHYK